MHLRKIPYQWLVAIVFVAGLFMELLDTTVVYVALPTLGREFDVGHTALEWVVTGYLLSLAVWIPASGWLGDRFGTKKVFLVALALFTLGSALCGLAWNIGSLIGFRVLQGVGGGMLTPVGSAMLFRAFPPRERARAATVATVPAMIAPTLGPIVGGFLVDGVGWRWIFAINVPIGIAGFGFALAVLKEHVEERVGRFDLPGFLLAGAALPLLLYGLSWAPEAGWESAAVLGPEIGGLALLALLVAFELRTESPMLDLRQLTDRMFLGSNAVFFAGVASALGVLFLLPLYLQQLRGLTALESGLTTFPQALGLALFAPLAGRLYRRLGPRRMLAIGMGWQLLTTLPFLWLNLETSLWAIRGLMLLRGVASALVVVTVQVAAFAALKPQSLGRASALFHTNRQVASSVGVAILATVVAQRTLASGTGAAHQGELDGFHAAFLVAVLISTVGLALVPLVRVARAAPAAIPVRAREAEALPA
jgi:EmrB/QacA subfamily drug resistance transporter